MPEKYYCVAGSQSAQEEELILTDYSIQDMHTYSDSEYNVMPTE